MFIPGSETSFDAICHSLLRINPNSSERNSYAAFHRDYSAQKFVRRG